MAVLHARCFTTPRPWSATEFVCIQSDPLCFTLIESDGFLVGRAVAGEAEILTLAVDPAARRQRVGTRLVQAFLKEARSRTAGSAFLEVAADNQPAMSLYLQAGFVNVGARRGYYTPPNALPLDAVVMSRSL